MPLLKNRHVDSIFKIDSQPIPWQHMLLCGIATCAPLLVGWADGHIGLSVYGSILGYLVALNDHFGKLRHRLVVSNLTYLLIIAGFTAGLFVGNGILFWLVLAVLSYWLGVLSGTGAEMEKAFLFSSVGLLVSHASPVIPKDLLAPLALYTLVGYLSLMLGMFFITKVSRVEPKPYKGLVESFKKSLTKKIENHIHAFSYASTVLLAAYLVNHFKVERGYWVTITVMLVMRPDRTQSVYVTLQRLIGTLVGVLFAEVCMQTFDYLTVLVVGAAICAAAVPWATTKNYAAVAFFVTIMVVFLLELSQLQHLDAHLPWVRFQATYLGCGLSILGTLFSKLLDNGFVFLSKNRKQNSLKFRN